MAFHLQTFKTRTATAIVFVIVMLCGLLINHWSFFLLFTIIHFGCWYEFEKIAARIYPAYKNISSIHAYGVMLAGWAFMLWKTNDAYNIGQTKLSEIGWYLMLTALVAIAVAELLMNKNLKLQTLLISAGGLLYISFSCGCMIDLRTEGIMFGGAFDIGLVLPLLLIATLWVNDTMAYIVGSLIGKTQLSKISPKKTWEGTIGGIILAVAAITICGYFIFKADVIQLIIITAIACLAGVFGDLFESKLKRMANIKDSSNIMPGHGGFLDRFDSLLFATTFVWLYVKLFM